VLPRQIRSGRKQSGTDNAVPRSFAATNGRPRRGVADATYYFVVRPRNGQPQQRAFASRDLQPFGTLHIDLLAFGRSSIEGPMESFVEMEAEQERGGRARVSNGVTVP